eukprot:1639226-Rhodomonas_salina.4
MARARHSEPAPALGTQASRRRAAIASPDSYQQPGTKIRARSSGRAHTGLLCFGMEPGQPPSQCQKWSGQHPMTVLSGLCGAKGVGR